jgi:hypothetical protein
LAHALPVKIPKNGTSHQTMCPYLTINWLAKNYNKSR